MDRLGLVIFGNIMIAMAIIAWFDWHSLESAMFGLSVGVVVHIHYWSKGEGR